MRLYSLPSGDFNDITSGNNVNFSAGPGWDPVTGLGSPVADQLVPGLTYDDDGDIRVTAGTPIATQYSVFDGRIATITGANPNRSASDFTAQILWYDGTTSEGTVVADPQGGYDVIATHTFATTGMNGAMVTVTAAGDHVARILMEFDVSPSNVFHLGTNRILGINAASLGAGNDSITVLATGSEILADVNGQVGIIAASNLAGITMTTGNGTNVIDIDETAAGVPVTVSLGNGANTVSISGLGQDLDYIAGNVTIQGGTSAYTLDIDDQDDSANHDYFLAGSTVYRDGSAAIIYSGDAQVVLNGGSGGEIYQVGATESGAPPLLAGATAGSTLTVNTAGAVGNQVYVIDAYTLDSSNLIHDSLTSLPILTINGQGTNTLTLDETGAYDDPRITRTAQSITVVPGVITLTQSASASGTVGGLSWSSAAGEFNEPFYYNGVGTLQVEGDTRVATNFQVQEGKSSLIYLPSAISIQGGRASGLTIDAPGNVPAAGFTPLLSVYTITGSAVILAATGALNLGSNSITATLNDSIAYSGIGKLEVEGGPISEVFSVQGTAAATATIIDAGTTGDTVGVGNSAGSLAGIKGPLTVNGSGSTSLVIAAQGDAAQNYALTATTLTSSAAAPITFGRIAKLALDHGHRQLQDLGRDEYRGHRRGDHAHPQLRGRE